MKIASAASAFPKHYYSQKFLLEKLQEYWGDQLEEPGDAGAITPERRRGGPPSGDASGEVQRDHDLGPGE